MKRSAIKCPELRRSNALYEPFSKKPRFGDVKPCPTVQQERCAAHRVLGDPFLWKHIVSFMSGRPLRDWTAREAAMSGHVGILQIAELTCNDIMLDACRAGRMGVVRYLLSVGELLEPHHLEAAAVSGHVELTRFIMDRGVRNRKVVMSLFGTRPSSPGIDELRTAMLKLEPDITPETLSWIKRTGRDTKRAPIVARARKLMTLIVQSDDVGCFMTAMLKGYPLANNIARVCALDGRVKIFEYLLRIGRVQRTRIIMWLVLQGGNAEILRIFLREWPETATEFIDIVDRAVSVFDLNDETLTILGAAGAASQRLAVAASKSALVSVLGWIATINPTLLTFEACRALLAAAPTRSLENVARCAWLLIELGVTDLAWFTAQFAVSDCVPGIKAVIALGMDAHRVMPLALTCRSPMALQFLNVLGVPIPNNAVELLWSAGRRPIWDRRHRLARTLVYIVDHGAPFPVEARVFQAHLDNYIGSEAFTELTNLDQSRVLAVRNWIAGGGFGVLPDNV